MLAMPKRWAQNCKLPYSRIYIARSGDRPHQKLRRRPMAATRSKQDAGKEKCFHMATQATLHELVAHLDNYTTESVEHEKDDHYADDN
jgi:hypothetical protein